MLCYRDALAIWRGLGEKKEIANAIYNLIFAELLPIIRAERKMGEEEVAVALANCDEALALFREIGDRSGEGNITWALGNLRHHTGNYQTSLELFDQSASIFREVGQRSMEAWADHMVTLPLVRLGRLEEAGTKARAGLAHFHDVGNLPGVAMALRYPAGLAVLEEDHRRAGLLAGAAEKLLTSTGAGLTAYLVDDFRPPSSVRVLPAEGQLCCPNRDSSTEADQPIGATDIVAKGFQTELHIAYLAMGEGVQPVPVAIEWSASRFGNAVGEMTHIESVNIGLIVGLQDIEIVGDDKTRPIAPGRHQEIALLARSAINLDAEHSPSRDWEPLMRAFQYRKHPLE